MEVLEPGHGQGLTIGARVLGLGLVIITQIRRDNLLTCVMVVVTVLVLVSQVWVVGIQIAIAVVKVVMEAGS